MGKSWGNTGFMAGEKVAKFSQKPVIAFGTRNQSYSRGILFRLGFFVVPKPYITIE